MAFAYLLEAFGDKAMDLDWIKRRDPQTCGILKRMIEQRVNSPRTSSMAVSLTPYPPSCRSEIR